MVFDNLIFPYLDFNIEILFSKEAFLSLLNYLSNSFPYKPTFNSFLPYHGDLPKAFPTPLSQYLQLNSHGAIRIPSYRTKISQNLTFTGPRIVKYFYRKTNQMHQCLKFILFWNNTLHVSDGFSVHH